MKFVHTADWHIGANRRMLPNRRYLDRQMAAIEEIFDYAEQTADGRVVIAGDVFDRKNVLEVERNALLNVLERKERQGFRIVLINGNHDILETDRTSLKPILIFRRRLPGVVVASCKPRIVDLDGTTFVLYPPWARHCLDSAKAHKELRTYLRQEKVEDAVLVTHLSVSGAKTETGYVLEGGAQLRSKRIAYWCLGDVHRMQTAGRPNAWYSGNPCHHKWGEDADKGVLLVDTENPTEPLFHKLTTAEPFLTIRRVPRRRPGNAYCRLVAPIDQIPPDLPSWVIATKPKSSQAEETLREIVEGNEEGEERGSVLTGIERHLRSQGITKDCDLNWCMKQIEKEARTV